MKTSAALVKLIVFMIVTSMMTFVLAATIGNFSFGDRSSYKAEFTDVTGLLPGNEVRIAGVRVGKVDALELEGKTAVVEFSLDDGRTISDSAQVALRYRNLVGERYLAVVPQPGGGAQQDEDALIPDDRTTEALDLTVLFNGFKPLFQALDAQSINQVSFELIQVLQGEGGTVESLLQRTASLTNTLADRDAVIGRVIDNLTTVLATVDDRQVQVDELVTQLQRLSSGFAADREAIGASLDGINELTTATAGLLADVRGPLRADIAELQVLATTLDDQKEVVDGVLERLPGKLDQILSTAVDGGWFNFYLCGATLDNVSGALTRLGLPQAVADQVDAALPDILVNQAQRCTTTGGTAQ